MAWRAIAPRPGRLKWRLRRVVLTPDPTANARFLYKLHRGLPEILEQAEIILRSRPQDSVSWRTVYALDSF